MNPRFLSAAAKVTLPQVTSGPCLVGNAGIRQSAGYALRTGTHKYSWDTDVPNQPFFKKKLQKGWDTHRMIPQGYIPGLLPLAVNWTKRTITDRLLLPSTGRCTSRSFRQLHASRSSPRRRQCLAFLFFYAFICILTVSLEVYFQNNTVFPYLCIRIPVPCNIVFTVCSRVLQYALRVTSLMKQAIGNLAQHVQIQIYYVCLN